MRILKLWNLSCWAKWKWDRTFTSNMSWRLRGIDGAVRPPHGLGDGVGRLIKPLRCKTQTISQSQWKLKRRTDQEERADPLLPVALEFSLRRSRVRMWSWVDFQVVLAHLKEIFTSTKTSITWERWRDKHAGKRMQVTAIFLLFFNQWL